MLFCRLKGVLGIDDGNDKFLEGFDVVLETFDVGAHQTSLVGCCTCGRELSSSSRRWNTSAISPSIRLQAARLLATQSSQQWSAGRLRALQAWSLLAARVDSCLIFFSSESMSCCIKTRSGRCNLMQRRSFRSLWTRPCRPVTSALSPCPWPALRADWGLPANSTPTHLVVLNRAATC